MVGQRFCGHCHAECAADARFCAQCGHALSDAVEPSVPGARPAAHWGEVKPATILFADVADSTRQIADLSPEQAMQQLQPAIERMVAIVEAHGGTVLRTLGDGVMALFGVPRALEQHAEQACLAAVHMQQAFAAAHDPDGTALSLRIGLHTGRVASDPTEAGDRRGGGAHGVAIHLASRVASQAEPGQILLTEDTMYLLRPGLLIARPMGTWHLKGIVPPVRLFTVALDSATRPPPPPAPSVVAGRFVGRANEMAQLVHAFGRTRAGHGQVLAVGGEAGAGKTRLCSEFARRCRDTGARVAWVQAHPLSHATPLRPARDLLGQLYFDMAAGMSPAQIRWQIDAALARAGPFDPEDAALMHEWMGVVEQEDHSELSLAQRDARQARVLAAVAALVRAHADELRLIVLEDLHWLDEGSWPIVLTIAESLRSTRTLLLANHRRPFQPPWNQLGHAASMVLGELGGDAMRLIVSERLAGTTGPIPERLAAQRDEWIDRVVARSQGNPFFAEELLRHLKRSGADISRWTDELPDSIGALIVARIDALPEGDKRVLQCCAVIGKQIDVAVLARVLRLPRGRLAAALRRLQSAELLTRAQPVDGIVTGLMFAHPLIQEAAYGAQLSVQRQREHALVAEVLERRYAAGPHGGELAALMAHHCERANLRLAAARHAARAAQWLRSGDAAFSIERWRQVLTLLEREPETDEVRSLSALAAGRIVFLGWRGGVSVQEVGSLIGRALEQASRADLRLPQLLRFARARMLQASGGSADEYVATIQQVLAMPAPPGDAGRRALLHVPLCQAYGWAGRLREALAASDVALAGLDDVSEFDREFIGYGVEQWALGLRMRTLCRLGRVTEAQQCRLRLREICGGEADAVLQGIFLNLDMELEVLRGRGRQAWRRMQTVDLTTRRRNDYLRITDTYFFALLEMGQHQYARACTRLQEGLADLRQKQVAVDFEAEMGALLAEALAARGWWAEAARVAHGVVELSRQRANRVSECRAALVLARAELNGQAHAETPDSFWLARAGDLLDETGCDLWRPMWRALHARRRARARVTQPI